MMVSLSSLLAFILAWLGWRKKAIPARLPFIGCMLTMGVYVGGYGVVLASSRLETMIFWDRVEYIGVAFLTTFWLMLAIQFCGWEHRYKRHLLIVAFLLSFTTMILHHTTHLHGLMFKNYYIDSSGIFPMLRFTPGPWYWVSALYDNAVVLFGNVLFVRMYLSANQAIRRQIAIMLVASCIPWAAYIIYMLELSPPGLDIIAISHSPGGLLFFLGLYRYGILDLVPIARSTMLDVMHESVIAVDDQGRMVDCNRAARELMGIISVQGCRLTDILIHQPQLLAALMDENDHRCKLPGEPPRYLFVRNYPLRNQQLSGRLIVSHDVTEQTLVRQELEQLNATLSQRVEDETARRMEQERLMLSQSRHAAMGEMIGAIAHQWRQPLTAVSALVQNIWVAHNAGLLDDAFIRKTVEASVRQCVYMSETIDEFRNMLKPDKLSESFPLAAKTGEAVAIFQSQLASSRIKFEMIGGDTPEIMVEGFQGQYKQAVLNLVSNARHAIDERRAREEGNAPQGRIGIVMECCKGNAVIRFNDNGCGISPEVRERIFDPYFTTKPEGVGTGIGLYTARMIIENSMGGSLLLAESRPGEGSSFVITLPVTGSLGRNSTFPT